MCSARKVAQRDYNAGPLIGREHTRDLARDLRQYASVITQKMRNNYTGMSRPIMNIVIIYYIGRLIGMFVISFPYPVRYVVSVLAAALLY